MKFEDNDETVLGTPETTQCEPDEDSMMGIMENIKSRSDEILGE